MALVFNLRTRSRLDPNLAAQLGCQATHARANKNRRGGVLGSGVPSRKKAGAVPRHPNEPTSQWSRERSTSAKVIHPSSFALAGGAGTGASPEERIRTGGCGGGNAILWGFAVTGVGRLQSSITHSRKRMISSLQVLLALQLFR